MRRGRRSRRLDPDVLAGFPDEMLQNILVRLPAKSVLRCRAVCREWRRITTDPAFLVAHHGCQPMLPLVKGRPFLYHLEAIHLQTAELLPVYRPKWYSTVHASCDGLVIIDGRYICNPATHQLARLSLPLDYEFFDLYRHQPSGEYRVLFWTNSSMPSEWYCPNDYWVLTVGSKEPRRIACSITQADEELRSDLSGIGPDIRGAPVHLHGNVHVHRKMRGSHYHRILVFDTVAESFRQMRPPSVNPQHIMQLFDMGGKLAASSSTNAFMAMRIFALQDYESQAWSFQYRIKLPEMEIRRFQEHGDWLARVVSGEGDLLVSCFGWLLHCDRNGNLLAKFQYDEDDFPSVTPHRLKESLIQHAFFQESRDNCARAPDGLQETSSSAARVGRRPRKPNPRVFGDEWVN